MKYLINLINDVHKEDLLVFAYAHLVSTRHYELVLEQKIKVQQLLGIYSDFAKLDFAARELLLNEINLLTVLEDELSDFSRNPYNIFYVSQRLYDLNHAILAQIAVLRDNDSSDLEHKIDELHQALTQQYGQMILEILDFTNREQILTDVENSLIARGLKPVKKGHHASELIEHAETTAKGTEVLSHFLQTFAEVAHGLKGLAHISHDLPFLGLLATTISITCALIIKNPLTMGAQETVNFAIGMVADGAMLTKNSLEVTKIFVESLEHSLQWLPLLGAACALATSAIAIGNAIRAQLDYEKYKNLLLTTFVAQETSEQGWLLNLNLSEDDQKTKDALLKNMSIKYICENPEAVKSLFTQQEFESQVLPVLLEHLEQERNKKIATNVINAIASLTVAAILIAAFCIPVVGQILALTAASIVLTMFITRLVLGRTLLKSQENPEIVLQVDSAINSCKEIADEVAGLESNHQEAFIPPIVYSPLKPESDYDEASDDETSDDEDDGSNSDEDLFRPAF